MESEATQAGSSVEESNDKKSRVDWWAIATGAWIVVVLSVGVAKRFWNMELNSMGDYVAGAFAPPALIWLVRGYYQQGKALQVQISELKQSVAEFSRQTELMELASQSQRSDQAARQLKQHIEQIPIRLLPVLEAFRTYCDLPGSDFLIRSHFHWRGLLNDSDPSEFKTVISSIARGVEGMEAEGTDLDIHLRSVDGRAATVLRLECSRLQNFVKAGWRLANQIDSDEWEAQARLYGVFVLTKLAARCFEAPPSPKGLAS